LRRLFLCSLIVAAVAGTTNTETADKWLRIRSKNFLLVGNASESSIRRVGRTLEEFGAGVALIFPAIAQQTSPPITVLALVSGEELTQTEDILKRARDASPGKRQLRLRLAELMLANNETLAARVMVSASKNVTDDDAVQRRAQSLLDQIQKRRQTEGAMREYNNRQRAAEQTRAQAAAIRASAPSTEPDGPPKIRYNQTSPPANDSRTETTSKPIVRPAGKELEGSPVSIDSSQGMMLRVRIANNANVELYSEDPSKIEFVSYSAAVSGSFTCGQFKTDTPVLIVYRDASNLRYLGEPLRVEFTHIK
jgi:hypothetical protein